MGREMFSFIYLQKYEDFAKKKKNPAMLKMKSRWFVENMEN